MNTLHRRLKSGNPEQPDKLSSQDNFSILKNINQKILIGNLQNFDTPYSEQNVRDSFDQKFVSFDRTTKMEVADISKSASSFNKRLMSAVHPQKGRRLISSVSR